MLVWAKRIYILIIKVNKLFSFFLLRCFLKEIENMFSMFLSSYRTLVKVWENSKKLSVETLAYGSCSHSISHSPKLPLVFLQLDKNTVYVFYFLIVILWIFQLMISKALLFVLKFQHLRPNEGIAGWRSMNWKESEKPRLVMLMIVHWHTN